MLLLIAGCESAFRGLDANVQQVRFAGRGRIGFGMPDARARTHALQASGAQHCLVAERILVAQLAIDEICQNLSVAAEFVRVALTGLDAILVHHLQRTKVHVLGIVVVSEYERIPGLEPAVVVVATVPAASYLEQGHGLQATLRHAMLVSPRFCGSKQPARRTGAAR